MAKAGSFGHAANVGSAEAALELLAKGETDIEKLSEAIHEGWAKVALHFNDPVYQSKPEKKDARHKLAKTHYDALADDEKKKDRVVAKALFDEYKKTAGK